MARQMTAWVLYYSNSGFDVTRLKSPRPVLTFMDRFLPAKLEIKSLAAVNFDATRCQDCGLCAKHCDTRSITRGSGTARTIHQETCKRCYTCARQCPAGALTVNWAKNEKFLPYVCQKFRELGQFCRNRPDRASN
jgi:NAD-dependent dihydropyrimidine dehydrogenase PreA subunit